MSKINIHRGTFLEKEELTRMIDFFDKNIIWRSILASSKTFGLVSPDSVPGDPFTVEKSDTAGCVNITGGYVIPGIDINPFSVPDIQNYRIPNGDWWLKLSRNTTNYEEGTVQIDASGIVSGTVNFKGIVRSQSSGVPTCVRFVKVSEDGSVTPAANNRIYQVLNIVDDYSIQLSSGYAFTAESDLKIVLLGSIPLGRRFTDEQQNDGLYTFDSYRLTLVAATEQVPMREDGEYIIARITASSGVVDTVDQSCRAVDTYCTYWSLGVGSGSTTYTFRIIANPSSAQVVINGIQRTFVTVVAGTSVSWTVSAPGYNTQSGTDVVNADKTLNISLEAVTGAFEDFEVKMTGAGDSQYEPFEVVQGVGSEGLQVVTTE